jgi:hypothetical protein
VFAAKKWALDLPIVTNKYLTLLRLMLVLHHPYEL